MFKFLKKVLASWSDQSGRTVRVASCCRRRDPQVERLEDRTLLALIVPAYDSYPHGTASLYLDFDGHSEALWGYPTGQVGRNRFNNVVTPAFDLDGNAASFNAAELAAIHEIYRRVAEDFAPFNINVTTVQPGNFSDQVALRVAIGGSSQNWYVRPAGGVAFTGTFTNGQLVNTVYAFSQTWGGAARSARAIADAASHEAGHAFGLEHQRLYDPRTGALLNEYNPGTAERTPIMGFDSADDRTTWHNGTVGMVSDPLRGTHFPIVQDDMAVIADEATNGFGYRPDDHGNTRQTATNLLPFGDGQIVGSGVIETTIDRDSFAFIASGDVRLTVSPAAVGPNLDARIELYDRNDRLVAWSDPDNSLDATIRVDGLLGNYYVVLKSHGTYGDVGQYSVSGTVSNIRMPGMRGLTSLVFSTSSGGQERLQVGADGGVRSDAAMIQALPLRSATGATATVRPGPWLRTAGATATVSGVSAQAAQAPSASGVSSLLDTGSVDRLLASASLSPATDRLALDELFAG